MNTEQNRTRRPWLDWPARDRRSALGYVYAVAYSTGAVKVGHTYDPRRRADALRVGASQYGATITDAWLSIPHGECQDNERALHIVCAALGPRWAAETFAISLHDVIAAAQTLPMTNTPQSEPLTRSRHQQLIATRRERARALRGDGATVREVAEALGVSVGAAHAYCT